MPALGPLGPPALSSALSWPPSAKLGSLAEKGAGCILPPLRCHPRLCPGLPSIPPIQGAKLGLYSCPRSRGEESQVPPAPVLPAPLRSPAAAYQGCKTYWKSCRCKSRPPIRARNLSCNPKRAAGSKHAGLPARHHPASEILFKVSSGPEDASGSCGTPAAGQAGRVKPAEPRTASQNLCRF